MSSNYEQLVKALRCCAENFGCPIECPRYSPADEGVRACVSRLEKDAAAAIEALQAEVKRLNGLIDAQLVNSEPKRGEFEKSLHEMFDSIWDCDINHPIFQDTVGELMEAVLQAYDTVNTAKMEVQDA